MTLTARQSRALDSIEQQLRAREPRLASMFAIFTKLTRDELLPTTETVQVERWHRLAELIARFRYLRRRHRLRMITRREAGRQPGTQTRSGPVTRLVNVAFVPFIIVGLLVTALVIGNHGSSRSRCSRVASYHSLGVTNFAGTNCGWLTQSNRSHSQ